MRLVLYLTFSITLFSCAINSSQSVREPSNQKTHVSFANCILSIDELLLQQGIYWDTLKRSPRHQFHFDFDEPDFYAGYPNILFLGDGSNGYRKTREFAAAYPDQKFISSDFNYRGMTPDDTHNNLVKFQVDHRRALPFEDNSQDMILLKRGLCTCFDQCQTCGGLDLGNNSQVIGFFQEVIRIMNKQNPKARAILHGDYFENEEMAMYTYLQVIRHFKNHPQVDLVYLKRREKGDDRIGGIMIRPKNWN